MSIEDKTPHITIIPLGDDNPMAQIFAALGGMGTEDGSEPKVHNLTESQFIALAEEVIDFTKRRAAEMGSTCKCGVPQILAGAANSVIMDDEDISLSERLARIMDLNRVSLGAAIDAARDEGLGE